MKHFFHEVLGDDSVACWTIEGRMRKGIGSSFGKILLTNFVHPGQRLNVKTIVVARGLAAADRSTDSGLTFKFLPV
jgi:hypothetical protein